MQLEIIFDIFQQAPWLLIVLLGIISSLFRGKKQEEQQQQQKRQQQQRQQRQQAASQASQKRQDDYEDYRRESATTPRQEEKPRFDWDRDVFGEGKLEELEQKVREKVEKTKEQVAPIRERMSQEVKELSIKGQEISKDSPILKQELQLSEGKVVNSRHRIKPNRVVEGVMWSEILGQPRSRNPHRPVYAEHFSKRK